MELNQDIKFNTKAKEYVPRKPNLGNNEKDNKIISKIPDDGNVQLNLKAPEYKPKIKQGYTVEGLDSDDEEDVKPQNTNTHNNVNYLNQQNFNNFQSNQIRDNQNNQKEDDGAFDLDEIIASGLDADLEDSDDERNWIPKYKGCECCKGFVYSCKGMFCSNLGYCYCMAKEEFDPES